MWVGARGPDFAPLFRVGIDIRTFFVPRIADRFIGQYVSGNVNAPTRVGIFAVVATTAAAIVYVAKMGQALAACSVKTCVAIMSCEDEEIVLAKLPELHGDISQIAGLVSYAAYNLLELNKTQQVQEWIIQAFDKRAASVESPLPAKFQKHWEVEVQPSSPLPEGARFIGEGPLGPAWGYTNADGSEWSVRQITNPKCSPQELRLIFEAQVTLKSPFTVATERFTLDANGEVDQVHYPAFSSHFERAFRAESLPTSVIIHTAKVVLSALQIVHSRGCLIRCITLRNIVFSTNNEIKLLTSYAVPQCCATTNLHWTTPWYVAPEALIENKWSEQSDMYSFGCVLYRMVTGLRPFTDANTDENGFSSYLKENFVNREPKFSHIPEDTDDEIVRLMYQLMSPSQGFRPTLRAVIASGIFDRQVGRIGDEELDRASAQSFPVSHDTKEFQQASMMVEKAVLKSNDFQNIDVVAVTSIQNTILQRRFNEMFVKIGNMGCSFHGALSTNIGSILRYGLLRSGHRLNPKDMSKWRESGTIGSTKRGVYLSKYPCQVLKYCSTDTLQVGDTATIVVCNVALGKTRQWPKGVVLSEENYSEGTNTFVSENGDLYVLDEAQVCPAYIVTVRLTQPRPIVTENAQKFFILEKKVLGKGSFGSVHLAIMHPPGRPIAVKKFSVADPACKSEFDVLLKLQEYRNIVTVYHFQFCGDTPYMFMELLACSISDLITNFGPMDEQQAKLYMLDAVRGLECLRLEGLVHCDIKPANMLLSHEGILKLTDFNLSRTLSENRRAGGTLAFLAPEVLEGQQHSHESDVWSLGASLYNMLVGKLPVRGDSTKPGPVLSFPETLTPPFRALLERCTHSDPKQRPSTVEIARELAKGSVSSISSPESLDECEMEIVLSRLESEIVAEGKSFQTTSFALQADTVASISL